MFLAVRLGLTLKKAEQVAQLLRRELFVQRFGHQGEIRLLELFDLRSGDPVRRPLALRSMIASWRLLDDQAAKDSPVLGGELISLIFLANDSGWVDEADQQKSRSCRLAMVRSGPIVSPSPWRRWQPAQRSRKSLRHALDFARAGPKVVVQPADLGESLLTRRSAGHSPVLANQGCGLTEAQGRESAELFQCDVTRRDPSVNPLQPGTCGPMKRGSREPRGLATSSFPLDADTPPGAPRRSHHPQTEPERRAQPPELEPA